VLVAVSPTTAEAVAEVKVIDVVSRAACEEGVDKKPNPIETVTASAIRLKNVFVDIYFLSLVDIETISKSAWQKNISLPRDAMHVLLHHILRRVSGLDEETQSGSSLLNSLINYINSLRQDLSLSWI
jgi:hypothetical protein